MPSSNQYITSKRAKNLIMAAAYAQQLGMPLNLFVTISWDIVCLHGRVQKASELFLHRLGDWLANRGLQRVWIWVLEDPPGKCLNEHIVLHLPIEHHKDFRAHAIRWLAQSGAAMPHVSNGIKIKPVYGLEGLLRYLLKGAEPTFCGLNDIEYRPQGTISGKRCGVSETVGNKARLNLHLASQRLVFPEVQIPARGRISRVTLRANARIRNRVGGYEGGPLSGDQP